MTKIKNTKKGMAKKTLSISLVAAMLATSNVPVWATEFSDGSDTSVFTSEAPAEVSGFETPVVENEVTPVAEAKSLSVETENADVAEAAELPTVFVGTSLDQYLKDHPPVSPTGNEKWYLQTGEPGSYKYTEVVADGTNGVHYATVEDGTYVYKVLGSKAIVKVKAVKLISHEAITGAVTISNKADNQWGYEAEAVYDTDIPEGVALGYRWETKAENEDAWTPIEDANAAKYTMQKEDCGKKLRVVAIFTNIAANQVIVEKESNSFKVAPLQITADDIIVTAPDNYGLNDINDTPTVTRVEVQKKDVLEKVEITAGTDYEIVTQNNDKPGIRTITIRLKGAYAGEKTDTVNLGEYSLENCKVTLESDTVPFVGDGKYAVPVIKEVKWANRVTLNEGTDYVIDEASVKDNIDVGTHTLTLVGRGDFTNSELTVNYTIVPRSMENCKIVWTGKPVIKGEALVAGISSSDSKNTHFVVTDSKGYVLIPNKDYTYDKEGIWDVSNQQCKVKVTGKNDDKFAGTGNYYGEITSDYVTVGTNIQKVLTDYVEKVVKPSEYTGTAITFEKLNKIAPEDVARALGISDLKEIPFKDTLEVGVHFDITYKNNVDAYLLKKANGEYLDNTAKTKEANGIYHYSQSDAAGKDSTIANDDPQAPQVYLTLKANYSGQTTPVRFAINQKDITSEDIIKEENITFDPTATDANAMTVYAPQMDALKMTYRGNALTDKTDYTFDYYYVNDTKDVSTENGTFKYEVVAHNSKVMENNTRISIYDGNYWNTDAYDVEVSPKSIASKGIAVADIENQKYSGKLVEPKVTVTDGTYTLVEGRDYSLSYKDNRSAGTATVTITGLDGKGRYKDAITKTFVIENKSIADAKLLKKGAYNSAYSNLSSYGSGAYAITNGLYDNDRPVKAEFDVVDANNNLLREGYDYTVKYENNTKVGTATIIITGIGDYEGTLEGTFNIAGKGIGGHFVEDSIPAQTYTGSAIEPKVTFVPDSPNLVEGVDYEITYEYNVNPGKGVANEIGNIGPKVVARGIGNYAGSVKLGFEIKKADITIANVTAEPAPYAGGMVAESKITVTNPASGKALIEGTDYKVEYVSGKNVGDIGTANIRLLNSQCYTFNKDDSDLATIVVTYNIVAKDLKDVTIDAIADQTETGEQIKPALTVKNGNALLREGVDYTVTYGENKEGTGTATITPAEGNKNYTGTQTVNFNIVKPAPEVGQAVIANVAVKGNTLTPILADYADGAEGYDFVLATVENTKDGRVAINKNIIEKDTKFYYVEEGTYYVYCHAWKRDPETKKKVFGEWSDIHKVEVDAVTPSTPKITSVKKSGSKVTVTFTGSKDANGYDVILGTDYKAVNGEKRPVEYGKLVKKNQKETTVVFTNVPEGTYYAGVHAYNRSAADGKKVFSKWSNSKRVIVK